MSSLLFANLRAVEVPPTRQCPARKRMGKPILSTPATGPRHPPRNSRRRRGRMHCPTPKRCPHVLMKALAIEVLASSLVILRQLFQPFPLVPFMTKNHQPNLLPFHQIKQLVRTGADRFGVRV